MRLWRAKGRDRLWPTPRTYLATTKTNMLVLENHATKPSEIALQESRGYPPKTWPTFNRGKQIIYDLPVRVLTTAHCKEPGSFVNFLPTSRSLNGSGLPLKQYA